MHVHSLATSLLLVLANGRAALGAPAPSPVSHASLAHLATRDIEYDASSYSQSATCSNPIVRKEWYVHVCSALPGFPHID